MYVSILEEKGNAININRISNISKAIGVLKTIHSK